MYHNLYLSLLLALAWSTESSYIKYSTVTGYFLQDDIRTNPNTFNYTASNFGLINRTYNSNPPTSLTQWQQFAHELAHLNTASSSTTYKLLFLARHGEGYHNTAVAYFGFASWNCYYAQLTGNATTTWADAHLTDTGIAQALAAQAFWQRQFVEQKMPAPQSYYVSPLYRALQTAYYTFTNLTLPPDRPFNPIVKELLREIISQQTCDHRSDRTLIHESFPTFGFEEGFAEQDPLWTGVDWETESGQETRSKKVLDEIFSTDDATWISVTSHSGEIESLLNVLGHREFYLRTGAVIPVLVKAETVSGTPTTTNVGPSRTRSRVCTRPPATSVSGRGCVCRRDATWSTMGSGVQAQGAKEL